MSTPKHPMQPVVRGEDGVIRFKQNNIVRYLLDQGPADLNRLSELHYLFDKADFEQFAQLIGYSVSGAGELMYMSEDLMQDADAEADRLNYEAGKETQE